MTEDEKYTVTVTGPGRKYEGQVSPEVGKQIIIYAVGGGYISQPSTTKNKAPSQLQPAFAFVEQEEPTAQDPSEKPAQSKERPEITIRRFFETVGPSRNPDRIAAIARYLELHYNQDGMNSFTRDDLKEWFKRASEPVPKNLARDIKWAAKADWIAEDPDEPDVYYLTTTGRQAVDNHFPKEALEKTRLSKKLGSSSRSNGGDS